MIPFSPALKRLGLVLFSLGVLLAFFLTALMTWADVEAFSYGFPRYGKEPMSGLSCPAFMSTAGNAQFSVTLKNTTERGLTPQVQVMVSEPGLSLWATDTKPVEMETGETETVTWEVSANNVVLGSFVFVKAYTFASYPQPDVEGTCGIFVVGIPWLRGDVLYWLWLATSLALLVAGLWLSDFRQVEEVQGAGKSLARKVLAALVGIGLMVGSAGWWPVGVFIIIVIAVALPAILFFGQDK
jgi:hypothetical protein